MMGEGPHHNEGEEAFALFGGGVRQAGHLERLVYALAYGFRLLQVLQEEAVVLHARHSKRVVHTPHLRTHQRESLGTGLPQAQ